MVKGIPRQAFASGQRPTVAKIVETPLAESIAVAETPPQIMAEPVSEEPTVPVEPRKGNTVRVSINLDPETHRALRLFLFDRNVSINQYVRGLIRDSIPKEYFPN